jgi:dTDP-glucose 4,6-dehydratase
VSASRTFLVTGGAGFIGSNAVGWLLHEHPDVHVVVLDAYTYAAHPESLALVARGHEARLSIVRGDVGDAATVLDCVSGRATDVKGRVAPAADVVWHLAAESHVDRSILGPDAFVATNVIGTQRVLEAVRAAQDAGRRVRLVHVGTDEVYGALTPQDPPVAETRPLAPSSPYAASKGAADLLVQGWAHTYGLDAVITRCSNNYGPFQFPEKLIPLMITRALGGLPLPVYGDGRQVRDWIHVEDHVRALWAVTHGGAAGGRVYNIGAHAEQPNLTVVHAILDALGKDSSLIEHVRDRPAHDRRYALDASRLRAETDWTPRIAFADGLAATVRWYVQHQAWWRAVHQESQRAADALYLRPTA